MDSYKGESITGGRPLLVALLAFAVFSLGAVIGGAAVEYGVRTRVVSSAAPAAANQPGGGDVATDLTRLKAVVPSQSHAMADVGYHWAGLWFAGQQGTWALAQFFFDETRQHIKWTIAIRPVRKDPDGHDVDLKSIYEAVDSSAFATVKRAIEEKDSGAFTTAYKQSLEACYSCHKTSGKPYLRPMVPAAPPQTIINYDPNASWPQ